MIHRGTYFVFAGIALFFAACNPADVESAGTRSVNKPWKDVSPPKQEFTFNAETGDTVSLENGTVIRIPAGILVNSRGEHVTGEVTLDYSTMYTPAEVIASGIPMDYDSAGSNFKFQSAGMFDLTAHQKGEELAIENGKSINMDFPTTRNDMTYSFYRYDNRSANWSFQNIPEVDSNEARVALQQKLVDLPVAPVKPEEYQSGTPVIDLEFDLQKHPELSCYEGIIWQYAGSGTNPENNQWIYQEVWENADLKLSNRETGTYALNLNNGQKSFNTTIRPVLKGADYQKALEEFAARVEKFQAEESARRAESERINSMPPFVTNLNILVFGTHNMDCIRHNPEFIFAKAKFTLPNFTGSRANVNVYIISGLYSTTIAYNATGYECYYMPNSTNKVVAVDHTTGKTYTMTSAEFSAAANGGQKDITLQLNESSAAVADIQGLEKMINEL